MRVIVLSLGLVLVGCVVEPAEIESTQQGLHFTQCTQILPEAAQCQTGMSLYRCDQGWGVGYERPHKKFSCYVYDKEGNINRTCREALALASEIGVCCGYLSQVGDERCEGL